ncbi:hypothetical protein T440DRAFT_241660 [Plenodomus tracheiphilus IPT5]|uniref:Uncharacterized protein n=1 Tax=Plenodomus tracheiphilus IPT5 TaxID=1408161 RepID=A0A6A7BGY5_9PLEO|nr:hypothetical protein T440DRAFT_241660 [Plenodomus tracheiphilus IPT5]
MHTSHGYFVMHLILSRALLHGPRHAARCTAYKSDHESIAVPCQTPIVNRHVPIPTHHMPIPRLSKTCCLYLDIFRCSLGTFCTPRLIMVWGNHGPLPSFWRKKWLGNGLDHIYFRIPSLCQYINGLLYMGGLHESWQLLYN